MQNRKKIKISFLNPPHADWSLCNVLTYIYLKSYYNHNGKFSEHFIWNNPLYKWDEYQNVQEIVDKIKNSDIVLFSSYVWNYSLIDNICKEIKKQNLKIICVLGGPHIGKGREKLFDFICKPTKPGETFFCDLLNSFFENNGNPLIEDISWEIRSNKKNIYKLESNYSVYEENYSLLKEIFEYGKKKNLEPFIALETTRGCPFSCVYCEWGGGINTKIYKKPIEVVKKDIDTIVDLGFKSCYLTDANFGVFFERDLEIYQYAFEKKLKLTDVSTFKSKDLKKRIELIDSWFNIVGENKEEVKTFLRISTSHIPNISIQSISDEAMKVAKRTDLCFHDKIKLSEYIKKKCEKNNYPVPNIEMILGMPGSTKEDFYDEMILFWNFKSKNERYDYMVLPDSEINNDTYKEKYKIKTIKVLDDIMDEEGLPDNNTLYKNKTLIFETIVSCYSFSEEDFKEMWFMNICTSYLLNNIYCDMQVFFDVKTFMKKCYAIIQKMDDFKVIKEEINDIFDEKTPPKSIKKIGGKFKKNYVEEFLEKNKLILKSELLWKINK